MAGLDTDPLQLTPAPHDGLAHCVLCATVDPHAEHDWCRAISGLVCEACCQRVLVGDLGRLMAAMLGASDAEPQFGPCAECERGTRWFARHILGHLADGTLPS